MSTPVSAVQAYKVKSVYGKSICKGLQGTHGMDCEPVEEFCKICLKDLLVH
jgi:hypothetical protein